MTGLVFAAIYRETFGQGANELVGSEAYLVVFLLGLLTGIFGLGALLVWQNLRSRARTELSKEDQEMLDGLSPDESNEFTCRPEVSEEALKVPWEREPDWWRR
tara:strand:- start:25916 stop:26224 length:309 start_codon:yes stop_codon:yes gene_type:complete